MDFSQVFSMFQTDTTDNQRIDMFLWLSTESFQ